MLILSIPAFSLNNTDIKESSHKRGVTVTPGPLATPCLVSNNAPACDIKIHLLKNMENYLLEIPAI